MNPQPADLALEPPILIARNATGWEHVLLEPRSRRRRPPGRRRGSALPAPRGKLRAATRTDWIVIDDSPGHDFLRVELCNP